MDWLCGGFGPQMDARTGRLDFRFGPRGCAPSRMRRAARDRYLAVTSYQCAEALYDGIETLRLTRQFLARGGTLLGIRSVSLGNLLHLVHSSGNLLDAPRLFATANINFVNECLDFGRTTSDLPDRIGHLIELAPTFG